MHSKLLKLRFLIFEYFKEWEEHYGPKSLLLYLEFSIECWTLGPLTWKHSKRVLLWKLNVDVHCNAFKCSAILNSHQSIAIINQVECSSLDEHLILILA